MSMVGYLGVCNPHHAFIERVRGEKKCAEERVRGAFLVLSLVRGEK